MRAAKTEGEIRMGEEEPGGGDLALLDTLVADPPARAADAPAGTASPARITGGTPESFVGDCLDTRHPTVRGRVLVRWRDALGAVRERWLPTLHGLAVRVTDRVLAQQPSNWPEPVVMGVIDGYAARPEVPRDGVATLALQNDEAIRVTTADGQPLLELHGSDQGPVVRLLREDAKIEVPGQLELCARGIALVAREGAVEIKASDDVTVQGEVIRLN
jgi:hypothetical protein